MPLSYPGFLIDAQLILPTLNELADQATQAHEHSLATLCLELIKHLQLVASGKTTMTLLNIEFYLMRGRNMSFLDEKSKQILADKIEIVVRALYKMGVNIIDEYNRTKE